MPMYPYGMQMLAPGEPQADINARGARLYALAQPYNQAITDAGNQAQSAALTGAQTMGNPFLAQRSAQQMAQQATAPLLAQRASAQASALQQEQQRAQEMALYRQQRGDRILGGLIGGAGSVLGTIFPAFGAARGVAGGIGGAMGAGSSPIGAGLLGVGQQMPQQPWQQMGYAVPPIQFGNRLAQPALAQRQPTSGSAMLGAPRQSTMGMADAAIGALGGPVDDEELRRRGLLPGGY